jgi:hypothetical protein
MSAPAVQKRSTKAQQQAWQAGVLVYLKVVANNEEQMMWRMQVELCCIWCCWRDGLCPRQQLKKKLHMVAVTAAECSYSVH